MKIIEARLEYFLDNLGLKYANRPTVRVEVESELPRIKDMRWMPHGEDCWLGEKAGWYQFFFHNGDELNHGGYGGAEYSLTLVDGSEKILKGPWSGGAYAVWQTAGIKLIEVTIHEKTSPWSTAMAGYAVTPERFIEEILPLINPLADVTDPRIHGSRSGFSTALIMTEPKSQDERWEVDFGVVKGQPQVLYRTAEKVRFRAGASPLSSTQHFAATLGL